MAPNTLALQPTFDEQAEPIPLFEALTPIGRAEPQIARFGEDHLAGLEVRHARIICEDGSPQLLDLSESGATWRNGTPIGAVPVRLSVGDVLRFGSRLEFRVEPMQEAALQLTRLMTERLPRLQLLLTPTSVQGPAAPIAITEFPFLISSSQGHFADYQAGFPAPMSFLSRRHAHVYQRADQLLLEDLGSTNGTKHNGEPLTDLSVALADGDEIRFGHRDFTFKVGITSLAATAAPGERPLPDGTVMISSAGSYLDVYCDNAPDDSSATTDPAAQGESQAGTAPLAAVRALLGAARVRWREWPLLRTRQLSVLVLLPLLLLGLALLSFTRDTRLQDARSLLERSEPQQALLMATSYLTEHPEATEAASLVAAAFEAAVLPGWIERMQSNRPAAALDFLEERLQLAPAMATAPAVELLRWMAELERFLEQTAGAVAVSVGSSNQRQKDLAAQWRGNADGYTRLLRRLSDSYAELAPVHSHAMSSIRALQGEGADQLSAVAQLQTRVAELMAQSQFDAARAALAAFAADHPALRDLDAFSADLDRLASISAARREQDLERFLAETGQLAFGTAFFGRFVSNLSIERRQALDVQRQLEQAATLWGEGRLQPALEVLDPQGQGPWNAVVEQRQARYVSLQQGFVELLARVGTSGYADAVIDFYVRLDATEDAFMHQALADDFASQRDRALANARQLATEGGALWDSYRQRFQGIGGGLRLESEVSDTYRELAAELSASVSVLRRAQRLFEILDTEPPAALLQQHEAARQEVARQRSALTSLRFVLGEALVQDKLDLLPDAGARS